MSEQRPWLVNYPKGVPANIDPDVYPNLVQMLEETFEKYKSKPAFTCMGKTLTYKQVDKLSERFGAYLLSRGLRAGDRVALMMPNLLQYPIALFGCLRAGMILVNTNPLYTPREMKHQFTDSGVKAIIIAENFAHNLEQVIEDTEIETVILTTIGEMLGFPKRQIVDFVVKSVKKMVPKHNLTNTVSFSNALNQGRKFSLETHAGAPEDVVVFQYTGGTTGLSKGAMLTNRNLIANMVQIRSWMLPFIKEGEGVAICPLPLYHIFAFTVNCLTLMNAGIHNVLVTNARDLPSVIKTFKSYDITLMTGVNTLFNALSNNKDFAKLDFSKLKVTIGGGAAVQQPVANKWKEITGCTLNEGYGMTESSPVATTNPLDDAGRLGSIGLPLPSTDIRVVDETGGVLPAEHVGELQIKGPQVMKGYYNKPEETLKCLSEDWLSTGDIGKMDNDGYFYIVDRKKDMINVSGFNVYPNEIEEVIAGHPKVLEVAAIGIPHDKSGEVVKVFVVKKEKSLSEKELLAYCRENLTGYKVPKEVEFRKELPKSNVGKILRRELREQEANA